MALAETSRMAFDSIKKELNKNEFAVYTAISVIEPCTNEQIADFLDWPIQSVTGRTNALHTKSYARALDDQGVTKSGRKAKRWVSDTPSTQAISWLYE